MASSNLSLRRTAVCLHCEACFPLGLKRCPECDGGAWMPMVWVLAKAQQAIKGGATP